MLVKGKSLCTNKIAAIRLKHTTCLPNRTHRSAKFCSRNPIVCGGAICIGRSTIHLYREPSPCFEIAVRHVIKTTSSISSLLNMTKPKTFLKRGTKKTKPYYFSSPIYGIRYSNINYLNSHINSGKLTNDHTQQPPKPHHTEQPSTNQRGTWPYLTLWVSPRCCRAYSSAPSWCRALSASPPNKLTALTFKR